MSIRDIIAGATPGPWEHGDNWWVQGASHYYDADAHFIATFDPEHVALMEAVCEAEDNGTDDELTTAGAALQAYRKEHGL